MDTLAEQLKDGNTPKEKLATTNSTSKPGKAVYKCSQCSYISNRANNLIRHKKTHEHRTNLQCCFEQFNTTHAFRMHTTKYHKKGFACTDCKQVFCRRALLKRHSSIHTGNKEFKCTELDCTYATSNKSNLQRHVNGKKLRTCNNKNQGPNKCQSPLMPTMPDAGVTDSPPEPNNHTAFIKVGHTIQPAIAKVDQPNQPGGSSSAFDMDSSIQQSTHNKLINTLPLKKRKIRQEMYDMKKVELGGSDLQDDQPEVQQYDTNGGFITSFSCFNLPHNDALFHQDCIPNPAPYHNVSYASVPMPYRQDQQVSHNFQNVMPFIEAPYIPTKGRHLEQRQFHTLQTLTTARYGKEPLHNYQKILPLEPVNEPYRQTDEYITGREPGHLPLGSPVIESHWPAGRHVTELDNGHCSLVQSINKPCGHSGWHATTPNNGLVNSPQSTMSSFPFMQTILPNNGPVSNEPLDLSKPRSFPLCDNVRAFGRPSNQSQISSWGSPIIIW